MNVGTFDLNLLRVFAVMMAERSTTLAGQRLGLSQSSVSHALRRLREACDDPLFVRTGSGMQPTAYALALADPIERALQLIEGGLARSGAFDPASARRTFNLLLSDIGQLSYLPRLAEHLRREAPGVEIDVAHLPLDRYRDALQSGAAHLAIGHLPVLVPGFHRAHLFDDRYVCLLSERHAKRASPAHPAPADVEGLPRGHARAGRAARPRSRAGRGRARPALPAQGRAPAAPLHRGARRPAPHRPPHHCARLRHSRPG
jgi:DNA-binding transcriptional LysR family regulator